MKRGTNKRTITITKAREDIYKVVDLVNENNEPFLITNTKGKNAVLLSESDYNSLLDTIHLMSNKATFENIGKGMSEPTHECVEREKTDF